MNSGGNILRKSCDIGVRTTAALTGASYLSYSVGAVKIAGALIWPYRLLQTIFPNACSGFSGQVHCGTDPASLLVFFASIFLSFGVYSAAAYGVLSVRRRRGA